MHPYFAPHAVEMLSALDERIKGRAPGPFQAEGAGGVLVGELADDPECLDPRARGRRPCIVRLALAPGPLSPPEQDRVLAYLRALPLPRAPGLDAALVVQVPQVRPLPSRTPVPTPADPRNAWRIAAWVLLALLAGGLLWLIVLANRPEAGKAPSSTPSDSRGKPIEPANRGLLDRYQRIDHPYIAFLLSVPEAWDRPRRSGEKSYEDWLPARRFAHHDHPLPRRIRERVHAWREPQGELADAALRMRQMRKKWGHPPAASLIDEVDAFFESVTRPEGLPPREEVDHPANAFLWRIPRDPVASGRTFDDERALRPALAELARALGASAEGSSLTLLTRIEKALDYPTWLEAARQSGAAFAGEGEGPGAAVEAGLRKFAASR
jgi:hypothetical protein